MCIIIISAEEAFVGARYKGVDQVLFLDAHIASGELCGIAEDHDGGASVEPPVDEVVPLVLLRSQKVERNCRVEIYDVNEA